MVINDVIKYKVNFSNNIRQAIRTLDEGGIGFLTIVDDFDSVLAVLTDGDFRRAILNDISLSENIMKIANRNFIFLENNYSREDTEHLFKTTKILHIPILDDTKLKAIITKEIFKISQPQPSSLNVPVVIMAGGKGTRMKPFTNILPKPLIPIGEKTMLEVIMEEYSKYGIHEYYLSVNYKRNMIKAYFEDEPNNYEIHYIEEDEPLGTAGSLKLVEHIIKTPFFVSNCDILVKGDYDKMYDFHIQGGFDLTIIGTMQHHQVPYGVCEIKEGGELIKIIEKPEYDFLVNTGMYILQPNVLDYIPENKFFHITHLIEGLKEKGGKVGVYPISEKSWIDVGQWNSYLNFVTNDNN